MDAKVEKAETIKFEEILSKLEEIEMKNSSIEEENQNWLEKITNTGIQLELLVNMFLNNINHPDMPKNILKVLRLNLNITQLENLTTIKEKT